MLRARFSPMTPRPAIPMSASAIAQESSRFFSPDFFSPSIPRLKFGMLSSGMQVALQLLVGATTCAAFILLARGLAPRRELRLYALGLAAAALIYVGFGARGASPAWLAL